MGSSPGLTPISCVKSDKSGSVSSLVSKTGSTVFKVVPQSTELKNGKEEKEGSFPKKEACGLPSHSNQCSLYGFIAQIVPRLGRKEKKKWSCLTIFPFTNLDTDFIPFTKINLKRIMYLNIRLLEKELKYTIHFSSNHSSIFSLIH